MFHVVRALFSTTASVMATTAVFAVMTVSTGFGCGGDTGRPTESSDATERTMVVRPEPENSPPETLAGSTYLMWKSLNSAHSVLRAREQEIIDSDKLWSKTLVDVLDSREWMPAFTAPGAGTPALDKLLAALRALPSHGLRADGFPIDELAAARDEYAAASGEEATASGTLEGTPGWSDLKQLVDRTGKPDRSEVESLPEAVQKLDKDALETLKNRVEALAAARKNEAAARAKVEVLGTLSTLKYVMAMKYQIVAAPFKAQKNPTKVHQNFTKELVESFASFASDPGETLKRLTPRHPYYSKLQDGLTAYRAMAAEGPFPTVKIPVKLSKGMKGSTVLAIKNRLSREGYFAGNMDNVFDGDLVKAVEDYQANHGFEVTGALETRHTQSLNTPIEKRIQQIELSLQRWRESEIRDGGEFYVRVNIPEFMMEVWKGENRVLKHKVVVGNNNWDTDPAQKLEGRINRTKLFSAAIESIVLNPRWNVPMRIRQVELDYDLLKKPDFLVQNNYVVEMLPDGREVVYQKSGEGNALGKIKFNFPNNYGIFMHDTNLKPYFKKEIRAFSHGCVRLEDPLEVAKYIAQEAAGTSSEFIDEKLAGREPPTYTLKLDRPVPIFIEYNSVGVDDQGRMAFFSDVYSYDKDFFDGKIPYSASELALLKRKVTRAD